MNDMWTIALYFFAALRHLRTSCVIFSRWNFIGLQFSWRHRMTPKYLDTCATPCRGRSHHNYRNIHHRSKEFAAPTIPSWSSRSLIVRGAQPLVQQQVGLHALKRRYEAQGFNPDLLTDVRRRTASKTGPCVCCVPVITCAAWCCCLD